MQTCKYFSLFAAGILFTTASAWCAGSSSDTSLPDISMPSMTSISDVSMPSFSSSSGNSTSSTSSATSTGSSTTTAAKSAGTASSTYASHSQSNSAYGTSSSASTSKTTAAAQLSGANTISASDLSSLANLGLLKNLTSSTVSSTADQTATNALLQQILDQLVIIKEQNDQLITNTSPAANTSAPVSQAQASFAPSTSTSRLLRFTVNRYNILNTCRSIYISSPATDGSFLVSGDRKYLSDGKPRSETFYILFRLISNTGSISRYTAAATVTQDYENTYSFLYQLSKRNGLTAEKTGNVLTLQTDDPTWKLDLVIDTGKTNDR